jgi:hypothetical protein
MAIAAGIGGWLDVDFDIARTTVTAFVPHTENDSQTAALDFASDQNTIRRAG